MLDCSEEVGTAMSSKLPIQKEKMSKIMSYSPLYNPRLRTQCRYWMDVLSVFCSAGLFLSRTFLSLSIGKLQVVSIVETPIWPSEVSFSIFFASIHSHLSHSTPLCTSTQSSLIESISTDGHQHFRIEQVGGHGSDWSTMDRCRQIEGQSLTV